jgi:hypothetical protein
LVKWLSFHHPGFNQTIQRHGKDENDNSYNNPSNLNNSTQNGQSNRDNHSECPSGNMPLPSNTNNSDSNDDNGADDSDNDDEGPSSPDQPDIPDPGLHEISEGQAQQIFKYVQYVVLNDESDLSIKSAFCTARMMADKGKVRTSCTDLRLPKALLRHFQQIKCHFFRSLEPLLSYYAPTNTWERSNMDEMWNDTLVFEQTEINAHQ